MIVYVRMTTVAPAQIQRQIFTILPSLYIPIISHLTLTAPARFHNCVSHVASQEVVEGSLRKSAIKALKAEMKGEQGLFKVTIEYRVNNYESTATIVSGYCKRW